MNNYNFEDILNKCRCCFQMLKPKGNKVKIKDQHKIEFLELTQVELRVDRNYSKFLCKSCDEQLSKFAKFKSDAVERQNRMYQEITSFTRPAIELIEIISHENHPEIKKETLDESLQIEQEKSSEKPSTFDCTQCDKNFITKSGLRRHIVTIHKIFDFRCEICNLDFPSDQKLRKHVNSFHVESFDCDICSKKFQTEGQWRSHKMYVHEKNIACDFEGCPEKFASQGYMRKHFEIFHLVS